MGLLEVENLCLDPGFSKPPCLIMLRMYSSIIKISREIMAFCRQKESKFSLLQIVRSRYETRITFCDQHKLKRDSSQIHIEINSTSKTCHCCAATICVRPQKHTQTRATQDQLCSVNHSLFRCGLKY